MSVNAGQTASKEVAYSVPGAGTVYAWAQYQGGMPHRDICIGISEVTDTSMTIFAAANADADYTVRWFACRL